nr:DUF3823 domain-containing protein [uncultured Bacteroides sp.]
MKLISTIFSILLLGLMITTSCTKDNYDAPKSTLYGHIVYNGESLQLRGTSEAVQLQLYQDGYERHDPITVYVGQDGAYSAKLFDGEYKMVTKDHNGPWVNSRDTTVITVKGSTLHDVVVTPFYTISNANIALTGNVLKASFSINKVAGTKIDRIILLVNTTQFVDDVWHNILRADEADNESVWNAQGEYSIENDLSTNSTFLEAKSAYARACVWSSGSDQGIYSPVFRLK